jgi:hypothetical protein
VFWQLFFLDLVNQVVTHFDKTALGIILIIVVWIRNDFGILSRCQPEFPLLWSWYDGMSRTYVWIWTSLLMWWRPLSQTRVSSFGDASFIMMQWIVIGAYPILYYKTVPP